MTHIQGTSRAQTLLLPACVDDYVGPNNVVRFIEAFVESLDLAAAGFDRAQCGPSHFSRQCLSLSFGNTGVQIQLV
jgi:transposase